MALRHSSLSLLLLLFGCQGSAGTPPLRPGWPDSCGRDSLGQPMLSAHIARPRMLLIGPTGADREERDCRGSTQEIVGRLVGISGTATQARYDAEVQLPAQLGAARTDWVVLPPLLVSADGVVTASSYQPALAGDRYRVTSSGGQVGASKAGVLRLRIEATADEPPLLLAADAGMALAEQGGRITVRFRVRDDGSGLVSPPPDRPELIPQVALFSLEAPALGLSLPLWSLPAADSAALALVPGQLPPGLYLIQGESRDQAGNRVRFAAEPGVPPGSARYQAQRAPLCIPPRLPPAPLQTALPLQVLVIGAAAGVDGRPPRLQGLSAEGAMRNEPLIVNPCQDLRLRMDLLEDRRMPVEQEAFLWVGPLDATSGQAALVKVPAYPMGSPERLEARYAVPAEAAAGPWIFLPAQAADAAGNALYGSHEPVPGGPGAIRLGDLLAPPGPDPQVPGLQRGERSPLLPGQFCVRSCTPGGGTAGPPAVLEAVELVSEDASAPLRGGRTLTLRFTFSRAQGGLPTSL